MAAFDIEEWIARFPLPDRDPQVNIVRLPVELSHLEQFRRKYIAFRDNYSEGENPSVPVTVYMMSAKRTPENDGTCYYGRPLRKPGTPWPRDELDQPMEYLGRLRVETGNSDQPLPGSMVAVYVGYWEWGPHEALVHLEWIDDCAEPVDDQSWPDQPEGRPALWGVPYVTAEYLNHWIGRLPSGEQKDVSRVVGTKRGGLPYWKPGEGPAELYCNAPSVDTDVRKANFLGALCCMESMAGEVWPFVDRKGPLPNKRWGEQRLGMRRFPIRTMFWSVNIFCGQGHELMWYLQIM